MIIGEYSCPACKSASLKLLLADCQNNYYNSPEKWQLLECSNCKLVFTTPFLDEKELGKYYTEEYEPYNARQSSLRGTKIGEFLRDAIMSPYLLRFGRAEWQTKPFGKGRMFEIGCGSGYFLKRAESLGWNCWGIDFSPKAVEVTKKRVPGANVTQSSLSELNIEELNFKGSFDLVIMSHVLEHLPDPVLSLNKCYELLAPGGMLMLEIPNFSSFEARFFGKNWRGLDLPRHLFHFREPVVRQLLLSNGFSQIKIRPSMSVVTFSDSLLTLLPLKISQKLIQSRIAKIYYYLMIFPVTLSYLLGNRAAIQITAIKE